METTSINTIKSLLTDIQQNLDAFREYHKTHSTDMDTYIYGSEKEYNLRGIISGVKNISADLSFLTRSHNLFIKLSTHAERNEIIRCLRNLNNFLINRNTVQGCYW